MKIGSRLSVADKHNMKGLLFLIPFFLGIIFFYIEPIFQSIQFSFSDVSVSTSGYKTTFVGLKYYKEIFNDNESFKTQLLNDFLNLLWKTPVILVLSLIFALLINQKFKGRIFVRAVFFLPVIFSSGVVLGIIQSDLIVRNTLTSSTVLDSGTINQSMGLSQLLLQAGLDQKVIDFVTNITNSFFSLIWNSGIQMLIFLSGLQSISGSLYEAASVEGASAWESFCKITIPMLGPMILLNAVYTVVDSYTSSSNSVMSLILSNISNAHYGTSSAMAWTYFIFIAFILGAVFLIYYFSTRTKKIKE